MHIGGRKLGTPKAQVIPGRPVAGPRAQPQPPAGLPSRPVGDPRATWLSRENRAAMMALSGIRRSQSPLEETAPPEAEPGTTLAPDNRAAQRIIEKMKAERSAPPAEELALPERGIRLWPEDTDRALAADRAAREPPEPWSLGADLNKYRIHAVKDGSRDSGESLKKALERAGMTLEDGVNVFFLGYASDRGELFRENDGISLFDDAGRAPAQAAETIGHLGTGLYSVLDLITFDGLPDVERNVYADNHPLVRPLVFTGQTIHGAWKTTEEIGNAVTWGYFDNVTGTIGMVIEDIVELLKHTGEAVTNIVRVPVQLIAGKDGPADETMDWVLLVPLEFVSNVLEMKGISNMTDYETAFAEKGVIGSVLELAGSTYVVYRALDELSDELKDDGSSSASTGDQGTITPEEPPGPSIATDSVTVGTPSTSGYVWTIPEGGWPVVPPTP